MKKLKIFELFAGIGAARSALERTRVAFESLGWAEIDKFAACSYAALYEDSNNYGDVQHIEQLPKNIDILFHGSPCQDFSIAGSGRGAVPGTRSNLMFETVRLVRDARPQVIVWENVKNVLSKKHRHSFEQYLSELEEIGYTNFYHVLNAKDYNVAQNRERVFCISVLNHKGLEFQFPKKKKLEKCLADYLDSTFERKFVMWEPKNKAVPRSFTMKKCGDSVARLENITYVATAVVHSAKGLMRTLVASDCKDPAKIIEVIATVDGVNYDSSARIYSKTGLSPTVAASSSGDKQVKVLDTLLSLVEEGIEVKVNNSRRFDVAKVGDGLDLSFPKSELRRGRIQKQKSHTLTTSGQQTAIVTEGLIPIVRKLKPIEYWRLMDFNDEQFRVAQEALNNTFYRGRDMSSTQLYKQAGNSIVVSVLEDLLIEIFQQIFKINIEIYQESA